MMQDFSFKVMDYKYEDFGEEFGVSTADSVNENADDFTSEYKNFDFTNSPEYNPSAAAVDEPIPVQPEILTPQAAEPSAELSQRSKADADAVIREAYLQAEQILEEARQNAEQIKNDAITEAADAVTKAENDGYSQGYSSGQAEGYKQALEESRNELYEQNKSLLTEISRAIAELERQKTDFIRQYTEEMKELVITIAEKVINISLQSSGDVIRRMITAAVENSRDKQWARIYISEYDENLMVREDVDILNALRRVSDNVKVVVMENGKPGDLIIEYPDQAVDAGVGTQLENIRTIMSETPPQAGGQGNVF